MAATGPAVLPSMAWAWPDLSSSVKERRSRLQTMGKFAMMRVVWPTDIAATGRRLGLVQT